jgi:F-type H+-transporting ATPase subunit a
LNEGTSDEKHFSIYLPIIVKTEAGWELFSSSHFYHHENSIKTPKGHEHYYANPEHKMVMFHEKIYTSQDGTLKVDAEGHPDHAAHHEVLDLSITKSVFGFLMVGLITILIFVSVANSYKKNAGKAPKGLQSFLEPLILFIRDEVAKPSVGHHYEKFTPFLLSTFFFIFLMNLLGLIPFLGGFNITGTLGVTAVLATVVFIITTINGNGHYWGHILWPPGVPGFVKVILIPIEILGIFIKPFVLMVRITANITAGHIIILSFVSLIFIFGQTSAAAGYGIGVGSLAFMIFMNFIELLVAFLQAYVFTLLAALYFGSATEEVHH